MRHATILRWLAGSMGLVCAAAANGGPSDPTWQPGFHLLGLDGIPYVMTVFDDGSGPALCVGGKFQHAGDVAASCIVKWDGQQWTALSSGLTGPPDPYVATMLMFDDGTGPALYVGGYFYSAGGIPSSRIARWDGSQWSPLGSGVQGNWWVNALEVFDDGTGPALFVGGQFYQAGGIQCSSIAKWNGLSWASLSGGVDHPSFFPEVWSLETFDYGNGPELYVGGDFLTAGEVVTPGIARWNGTAWSSLGDGLTAVGGPFDPAVSSLAVFPRASTSAEVLYVGGWFSHAGGVQADGFATWDGTKWAAVDFAGADFAVSQASGLKVIDLGSGPELWVSASIQPWPPGVSSPMARLARGEWSLFIPSGMQGGLPFTYVPGISTIQPFDDGTGSRLYVGGIFGQIGDTGARNIAAWDGHDWSPLGSGAGIGATVTSLHFVDGPTTKRLFAGGHFGGAGSAPATGIAEWDGSGWAALSNGVRRSGALYFPPAGAIPGLVRALAGQETSAGLILFAGGFFDRAGDVPVNNIARWDGREWSALDSGVQFCGAEYYEYCDPIVNDLLLIPSTNGVDLLVGGAFEIAGGVFAPSLARWNGKAWSGLGGGTNGIVWALALFDDGSRDGVSLFAAGEFSRAGGIPVNNIARWDGEAWHPLSSGTNSAVIDLVALDEVTPGGPGLAVGGWFTQAGGLSCQHIAMWNGSAWASLGGGLGAAPFSNSVNSMVIADLGQGPRLVAGGGFPELPGGTTVNSLAQWDGTQWLGIEGGVLPDDNPFAVVFALASVTDGPTPGLWVGGSFQNAGTLKSQHIARFGLAILPADLNNDGDVDGFDLALLLAAWGPCPARDGCSGDMNDDGVVNGFDLAILLASWT